MLQQIKALKDRVKHLLETTPRLRDSDNKLIATIWHHESKHIDSKADFLMAFSRGEFTSPETIRRTRQKIQEQFPHLKGNIQGKKKELSEEMRVGIKNV